MNDTYTVVCRFLSGSEAHGCRYVLLLSGDRGNISGIIIRDKGAETASTQVTIFTGRENLTELIAYEVNSSSDVSDLQYLFRTLDIFQQRNPTICEEDSSKTFSL